MISSGATYRWCGVLVVEGGGDVLPVVGERRRELLLAGDQHRGVGATNSRNGWKSSTGSSSAMSGRSDGVLERGDLGELAVLGRELGGRRHLDHLGVVQRALREGREPPQRLDLVAEQVDPHGAVLGRREHVQQPAADRELAAVLDLVDALVAGRDEIHRRLVEVDQLADPQLEPVRAHRRIGDLLRQRDRADDDHRRGVARVEQRVERRDPQTRRGAAAAPGATRR